VAVTETYLRKIRRAVRVNSDADIDSELIDIVEECRADLQQIGVIASKTTDESDVLILGAVRSFARWKFGLANEDTEKNREDYLMQRDELRRRIDYNTEV
jgi:predicted NUDIX family phosphoesterase